MWHESLSIFMAWSRSLPNEWTFAFWFDIMHSSHCDSNLLKEWSHFFRQFYSNQVNLGFLLVSGDEQTHTVPQCYFLHSRFCHGEKNLTRQRSKGRREKKEKKVFTLPSSVGLLDCDPSMRERLDRRLIGSSRRLDRDSYASSCRLVAVPCFVHHQRYFQFKVCRNACFVFHHLLIFGKCAFVWRL